jgi:predicted aminopeptidase
VDSGSIRTWKISVPDTDQALASIDRPTDQVAVALVRNFEFKLPLDWLLAIPVASKSERASSNAVTTRLRLRFSLWQNGLPADALPVEGWMELPLLHKEDLTTQFW